MTTKTPRTLSRLRKPDDMSLETWQRELRRQFGREQAFVLKNVGAEPVFSEYQVTNPQTSGAYRVAIRGGSPGDNYCTCGDFTTNSLGTCKHIEFVLGRLERKRATRMALERGFEPPYSEVVLQYGARREVRFRPGTACPDPLRSLASRYFSKQGILRERAFATFESFLADASKFGLDRHAQRIGRLRELAEDGLAADDDEVALVSNGGGCAEDVFKGGAIHRRP